MKRLDDDWLAEHGDTIRCVGFNAAEALFSAAAAFKSIEPGGVTWWWTVYEAIDASSKIFSCAAPPREVFEETFDGDAIHCQCAEVSGELWVEYLTADLARANKSMSNPEQAKKILSTSLTGTVATCEWETVEGESYSSAFDLVDGSRPLWYIVPKLNTGCCSGQPPVPPYLPYPDPIELPPYRDGCPDTPTNVYLIDSTVDRYGLSQNYYKVEFFIPSTCEYTAHFFYWTTHVGPYKYNTKEGHEGFECDPPYAPPHPFAALPSGSGLVSSSLSAVTYTLDAGCTYNQETEDYDTKFTYDVEANDDAFLGLARRMDALAWMINNSGLIPYTTCARKPVLEGDWVTLRFESDEPSPNGHSPIRKLLRYRSKSGAELGSITDYWRGFTWTTGPVSVQHADAWWGTPQVWAVSADEGKRVLRHVAGEAGIDPDQVGRWIISGSRNARYGVSLPVKLKDLDGGPWVTQRDAASGPAEINR